jgi:hypothetical protein
LLEDNGDVASIAVGGGCKGGIGGRQEVVVPALDGIGTESGLRV